MNKIVQLCIENRKSNRKSKAYTLGALETDVNLTYGAVTAFALNLIDSGKGCHLFRQVKAIRHCFFCTELADRV